jgi:hypothetical protein
VRLATAEVRLGLFYVMNVARRFQQSRKKFIVIESVFSRWYVCLVDDGFLRWMIFFCHLPIQFCVKLRSAILTPFDILEFQPSEQLLSRRPAINPVFLLMKGRVFVTVMVKWRGLIKARCVCVKGCLLRRSSYPVRRCQRLFI